MNEFKQDYENEKKEFSALAYTHIDVPFNKIDFLFALSNLLRARFEVEMMRGADTTEYIEMIKIASSFINK
jgi:hypothetical protein